MEIGKKWEVSYQVDQREGGKHQKIKVKGVCEVVRLLEKKKVPAGEFEVVKIVLKVPFRRKWTIVQERWYSPELGLVVELMVYSKWGKYIRAFTLVDYSLGQ